MLWIILWAKQSRVQVSKYVLFNVLFGHNIAKGQYKYDVDLTT